MSYIPSSITDLLVNVEEISTVDHHQHIINDRIEFFYLCQFYQAANSEGYGEY